MHYGARQELTKGSTTGHSKCVYKKLTFRPLPPVPLFLQAPGRSAGVRPPGACPAAGHGTRGHGGGGGGGGRPGKPAASHQEAGELPFIVTLIKLPIGCLNDCYGGVKPGFTSKLFVLAALHKFICIYNVLASYMYRLASATLLRS